MFSHVNEKNQPAMVDVQSKAVTSRTATAQAEVWLPSPIIATLQVGGDLRGPKGPVFQTAIVAGILAAKKTSDLIPMCHPLPVERCDIDLTIEGENLVRIICTVATTHKTGVEMEALTGATVAALTVHDMCKALSPAIEIRNVHLVSKTGGKTDYRR